MGAEEVNAFLTHLAVKDNVGSSTQGQALSAIHFLYRCVLDDPLPWLGRVVRAQKPRRLPVVLTRDEVRNILGEIGGVPRLVISLLYGYGSRTNARAMFRARSRRGSSSLLVRCRSFPNNHRT